MFCTKCGTKIESKSSPCPVCGAIAESPSQNPLHSPQTIPSRSVAHNKPAHNKSKTWLIVLICVILSGTITAGALYFSGLLSFGEKTDTEEKSKETSVTQDFSSTAKKSKTIREKAKKDTTVPPKKKEQKKPSLANVLNSIISQEGLEGNVSVAVVDNKNGKIYVSDGASDRYVAWGFYLPVYMAFCDMYPDSHSSYKDDIMSQNISACNSAGNFAIDMCGGTDGITNYLQSSMGYDNILIGRNYGDTSSSQNNYTSAHDSAMMLHKFNKTDDYTKLKHNPSGFGITVPAGASVYGQFGTENAAVKNNLNVFAIVKGANSDYSIAILTQNHASSTGIVNKILESVHKYMEEK